MEAKSLAYIEKDISKQGLALSNICDQNNPLSLAYRLPTEILEDIFILCARDYYYNFHYIDILHTWISISYVCSRWRNVALECPTLWSHIPIMPRRWIEELLARSKKAPLKIYISVPLDIDSFQGTLEKVASNIERICELIVSMPERDLTEDLLSKLSSRAPLLRTFKLSIRGGSKYLIMSTPLFGGDTPVLRTLKLSKCPAPWSSLKLTSLRTLNLDCVPVQHQQNVKRFLGTLSCMRHLRHLYLKDALPGSQRFISSDAFKTFREINLPRLSRLLIECSVSTVIAIIDCVNIPMNTEVRLGCFLEDEPPDNYSLLSSVLEQRIYAFAGPTQSNQTIRSLVIQRQPRMRLIFSALERDHESRKPPMYTSDVYMASYVNWGCNVPLQICFFTESASWERVISDFCCSIPLTHVRSVHVAKPPSSPDFWKRILGHIQDLRYLTLSQGNMPGLASLLSLPSRGSTENLVGHAESGSNLTLAPALEELALRYIKFGPTPDSQDMLEEATDLPFLTAALSTRKDPRVQLKISDCYNHASNTI